MTAYRATGQLDVFESNVIVFNDRARSGHAQTGSCVPQAGQEFKRKQKQNLNLTCFYEKSSLFEQKGKFDEVII